jgi:uncharacterized protein (TIGR00730 family)
MNAHRFRRICVFCGSRAGTGSAYRDAAEATGRTLGQRGIGLVYGGGGVGLMGVIAAATLDAGGEAIGVIPDALRRTEDVRTDLTELHIVNSMHERKALMADFSDAFIALPGGFGTYDEFCEILTWAQLGIHHKPIGLLNVVGFFDPLLAMFEHAIAEGFVRPEDRRLFVVETQPAALIDRLAGWPVVVQR